MMRDIVPLIALSLFFFASCRTSDGSESDLDTLNNKAVCCVQSSEDGTFYATKSCRQVTDAGTKDCCKRNAFGYQIDPDSEVNFFPFACEGATQKYLSTVEICRGPTRFRQGNQVIGGISDTVSNLSKFAHVWIKTSHKEVGMGPKEWDRPGAPESANDQLAQMFESMRLDKKVTVAWRDHTGYSEVQGSRCDRLYFCNETCVENETMIGASLGYYTALNQCHSASVSVLRKCGCYDHCVSWAGNVCLKHVFPELKGMNLQD